MTEKNEMTLNEYQERAMSTCMDSCDNFSYMMLNLVVEVGELASKVAKRIRKGEENINNNEQQFRTHTDEDIARMKDMGELGDILWQLSGVCHAYGYTLQEVADYNLHKLAKRKEAGTIDGSGDGIYDRT